MIPLLLALTAVQAPDSGVLLVRRDTTPVAHEYFHVGPDPATGGWILDATVRYDRGRPVVQLAPIVQIGADTGAVKVEFDAGEPGAPTRILGQVGRRRFTLRYVSRTEERAREVPDPGGSVIVDDSVFSLFAVVAWRATAGRARISAIFPRAGVQEMWSLRDGGLATTAVNGVPMQLRRVTAEGDRLGPVTIWTDTGGRIVKVEVSRLHLTAERQFR